MVNAPADRRSLPTGERSDLSDPSIAIFFDIFPHQRHGYGRMDSQASVDSSGPVTQYSSPIPSITTLEAVERERRGLGITKGMPIPTAALESQTSLSPQYTSNPYSSRPLCATPRIRLARQGSYYPRNLRDSIPPTAYMMVKDTERYMTRLRMYPTNRKQISSLKMDSILLQGSWERATEDLVTRMRQQVGSFLLLQDDVDLEKSS
jgi:hypothetical protein